jgi:tyrosyl-DNA phosphodiesterase 2
LAFFAKVLICGHLEATSLERIGVGVAVEKEETKASMRNAGELEWVTDHFGLIAKLTFTHGLVV